MQQKLYVLLALGVVLNSQAIKQTSSTKLHDYVNVQVYDDDDDEPMALNMDMNKMEKAMTNSHVELIVSDFEGSHHHHKGQHHHKVDQEAIAQKKAAAQNEDSDLEDKQTMVQQKANGKYADAEFDTKVLDEYTARTQGSNSNRAEKEDKAYEAKIKNQDVHQQHVSDMMGVSDKNKAISAALPKEAEEVGSTQVSDVPKQQQAPVLKAQTGQSEQPAQQYQPAQEQKAPAQAAPSDLDVANKELADAKAELTSAAGETGGKKHKKSKGGVESTADKALKRIMKVGEAMEKKIDQDLDDAPAKAPAAVPIGEKMKQQGQGLAKGGVKGALAKMKSNSVAKPAAQATAQPAGLPDYVDEKGMTTSDVVNEIVNDMKVEGLESSSMGANHGIKQEAPQQQNAPVAAPIVAQPQAAPVAAPQAPVATQPLAAPVAAPVVHTQQQSADEKRHDAIRDTIKVIQEDGAGEDNIESVSDRLTDSIIEKQERQSNAQMNKLAEVDRQKKQKEVNALQEKKVEEQKKLDEDKQKKPILSQQRGMILWPEDSLQEPELEELDTHYSFEKE